MLVVKKSKKIQIKEHFDDYPENYLKFNDMRTRIQSEPFFLIMLNIFIYFTLQLTGMLYYSKNDDLAESSGLIIIGIALCVSLSLGYSTLITTRFGNRVLGYFMRRYSLTKKDVEKYDESYRKTIFYHLDYMRVFLSDAAIILTEYYSSKNRKIRTVTYVYINDLPENSENENMD